jgi:hypothetical protein
MKQAIDIPVSPLRHDFSNVGEKKTFTLIFPALPADWPTFTLLEIAGKSTGFKVKNIRRNDTGVYHLIIS